MNAIVMRLEEIKANPQAYTPDEIRQFLLDLRGVLRFIAKGTPTELDDYLIGLLDTILAPGVQSVSVDWQAVLNLLLPFILSMLQKWLEKQVPSLQSKPNTANVC